MTVTCDLQVSRSSRGTSYKDMGGGGRRGGGSQAPSYKNMNAPAKVRIIIIIIHPLSELTNVLYLLALVILTLFSLVDTITEGS